jgi:hypothetical protein
MVFRRLIRHTGSGKVNLKALDVGPQFSAHMGMRLLPATRWSKFMNFEILMFLLLNAAGVNASERRVAVAFAPGYLTAQGTVAYAVSAEAEYNLQGRISLRGDLYALAAKSKPGVLQQSYQAMLGIVYNFERSGALSCRLRVFNPVWVSLRLATALRTGSIYIRRCRRSQGLICIWVKAGI